MSTRPPENCGLDPRARETVPRPFHWSRRKRECPELAGVARPDRPGPIAASLLRGGPLIEKHLVVVALSIGVHKAESGPDEGPLRSDVVQRGVGDHREDSMVGGDSQERDEGLRCVA